MYLSHLDLESHKNTRDSIRATIELTPDPIPVRYRVIWLATKITHLKSQTPVNDVYVNRMTELCTKHSDDEDDEATIHASNYHPQHKPYNRNKQQTPYGMGHPLPPTQDKNTHQNTKYNKALFTGSCYGCVKEGHITGE